MFHSDPKNALVILQATCWGVVKGGMNSENPEPNYKIRGRNCNVTVKKKKKMRPYESKNAALETIYSNKTIKSGWLMG